MDFTEAFGETKERRSSPKRRRKKAVSKINEEGLPIIGPLPDNPKPSVDGAVAICGTCGIRIYRLMSYSCPNERCPVFSRASYMGPIIGTTGG